jgi:RNA polymerase sigma-70 factor (ECF subfamily)
VIARDPAAFHELVERYERLVFRIVARLVSDPADREDLCQDVFLRVYERLDSFRAQAKLSTWIAQIAHHMCLHHLEKKRPVLYEDLSRESEGGGRRGLDVGQLASSAASPLQRAASSEVRAFVEGEIQRLPPVYRTLITLFHLEEMSIGEVSEVTSLPEGTVKGYLFRARRLLKERLSARFLPEEVSE